MKLTGVFLFAACMQLSASGISQNVTLKTSKKPLGKVLQEITRQTGYEFLYRSTQLKQASPVTIEAVSMALKSLLDLIFKDQPFRYEVANKTIVISPKVSAPGILKTGVVDSISTYLPPPVSIKGKVTDEKGLPLQGASVIVKGTKKATTTDENGEYHLEIPDKSTTTLVFSFVGMEPKEVVAGHQTEINIILSTAAQQDVVVVGYGTQKKANVTGSVATVKMDGVLGDRPVSTLSSLLQGVSPGLQVTITSGQPGASSSLNIRGGTDFGSAANSSINSGAPFILVDNVPFNGPLNLLDPNDIESVTVLKDAGSAAIYGARSAFGVILVTTKTGKKNQKTQLDYSNNFTLSNATNLPQKASPVQQVQSWIDGGNAAGYYTGQVLTTWLSLLQQYQTKPESFPGGYAVQNGVYYQLAPTDAASQLLGNSSFQQTHNLSVSGGSEKSTYRISSGLTNENGIIVPSAHQDNFRRYNIKSLLTTDVNPWLNVQLDAGYNNTLSKTPNSTDAFASASSFPAVYPLDSVPGVAGKIASPKNVIIYTTPTITKMDEIRVTGRTILKPLKGLTITGEYTIDNNRSLQTVYNQIPQTTLLVAATYVPTSIGNSSFVKTNASTEYNALNVYANYAKSFGKHNFSLLGGFNQEQSSYEQEILSRTQPISSLLPSISSSTGPITGQDGYIQYANRGVFGRLNYDYKNKYLIQVNGRYDGSSKFPDGHRWGFFPSTAIGWRISEEGFMNALKPVLTDLKLRASLGSVGNQNIANYQYYAQMNPYNPYWSNNFTSVTTLSAPGLISPLFTWESVQTIDYGIDWGFFRNRLTGTFDWYQRDTKNILTTNPTPLPALLGTGAPLQNSGALRTKGFELQINWKDKIGEVGYYIGVNLFDFQTVVTKSQNNLKALGNLYEGQKQGDIWGYVSDRLYTTDDFVAGTLDANLRNGTLKPGVAKFTGQAPNPGDMLFKDLDTTAPGNGIITTGANTLASPGDRKIIGNNTPRYQFGINGGVSYKNFDFSFVIAGVMKQDLWINNSLIFPNSYATYSALYTSELNYWSPTRTNAYFARIYTDNANGGNQGFNTNVQTRYLQNGAFLRVRNMTLRYSLPQMFLRRIHASRLQVFYSIENPFTFDHLPRGLYPDVPSFSSGAGNGQGYPFLRKSSVGINLSL